MYISDFNHGLLILYPWSPYTLPMVSLYFTHGLLILYPWSPYTLFPSDVSSTAIIRVFLDLSKRVMNSYTRLRMTAL